MSSIQSCSLSEAENVSAPCNHDHGVLDPAYYTNPLSISESFEFAYSTSYYPHTEDPAMVFSELSNYFTPDLGTLPQDSTPRTLQPSLQINTSPSHDNSIPHRPHSSPSSFRPNAGLGVEWPTELGQAARSDDEESPCSLAQPVTPAPVPTSASRHHRHASSFSSFNDFQNQAPRPQFTPILPHPVGLRQLQAQKRAASEDEWESPISKRKRSIPPSPQVEMTEEDTFLLRLKEDENLSWKEIATRFQSEMGKQFQVPALQMRFKRLRERMRTWTENDIQALKLAHDYWLTQKFEIIAAKIAEYGGTEKWTAKQCSRKWSELTCGENLCNPMARTPTIQTSYSSSPIDGPTQGVIAPLPICHNP